MRKPYLLITRKHQPMLMWRQVFIFSPLFPFKSSIQSHRKTEREIVRQGFGGEEGDEGVREVRKNGCTK